jgi:hypothetical protein
MLNHLSFTKLADMAEGRMAAEERAVSSSHLSACQRCAAKLTRLESVLGLMRTDEMEDAPREVVSRAINLFRSRAASPASTLVQRIVAALSFDSLRTSPAYGVRSGQAATARQLLYNAGKYDLDLRITETGEGWVVSGQVLGEERAGGRIELEGEQEVVQADLNEQYEFMLPAVPTGSYRLRLRFTDLEVEVPQLELRA